MEEKQLAANLQQEAGAGTLAEVLPRYYLAKDGDAGECTMRVEVRI